ncbi:MAG TPA: hypothetical protein DDX84_10455, partial [Nitrospiraceae bacterium]|nr:hypothetical protein [Nitrospiraceae bacterium]
LDTITPNTSITNQPSNLSNSASATFEFTSTESNSIFQCQLDNSGYSACISPKSYSGLTDGSHTFYVKATDTAGNTDPTPETYTWTVDTISPITTTSPKGGSFTSAQSVTLSCNDGTGSGCNKTYYTTDGTNPTTSSAVYAGPISISATATLKFFSVDKAGNSETEKSETYTINTTTASPDITATPATLSFGNVNIDSSSERIVSVRNDGNANLVIGAITNPSLPFSKVLDNCSGQTLSPSTGCTITIKFSPNSTEAFTSSVNIPSNDPDENPVTIALTGAGTSAGSPDITVLPSLDLSFPNIPVGVTADQTITVMNEGTSDLIISIITSPEVPFDIVAGADNCSNHTLIPDQSCTIKVRFTPAASGTFNSSLIIPSNDPDENLVTVNLSGSATPGTNNPPAKPDLIEPANGVTGMPAILTLKWGISTDADGDPVTYRLYIGTDPGFADVSPIILASAADDDSSAMAMRYSIGIIGLFGIIAVGRLSSNRKRMGLFIIIFIMVTGFIFTSCGSSGGGNGNKNGSDNKSYESYTINLQPNTTYYWKVVADDGEGGVTDSDTYSFTTGQ